MPILDELIDKERKAAEYSHNMYEYECSFYGKEVVDSGEKLDCVNQYEYHSQIAELLEELKKRRDEDYGYMADIHENIGYRKALSDFRSEVNSKINDFDADYENRCDAGVKHDTLENVQIMLDEVVIQLTGKTQS